MSEAKIEITIGQIHFSGQGDSQWVEEQLDKILAQAPNLNKSALPISQEQNSELEQAATVTESKITSMTLPTFLSEKNATSNQVRKFLATAIWLQSRGNNRPQTNEVTNALRDSNQKKLSNPAHCLNQNVEKGYCEKAGKQFFVTDEGKKYLQL